MILGSIKVNLSLDILLLLESYFMYLCISLDEIVMGSDVFFLLLL